MRAISTVFFAALALCLAAGTASASIIYETDVAFDPADPLSNPPILPVTVGPFDPNQPSYYALSDTWLFDTQQFTNVLPGGSAGYPSVYNSGLKIDQTSLVARVGVNSLADTTYITGGRGEVFQLDYESNVVGVVQVGTEFPDIQSFYSMATRGSNQATLIVNTDDSAVPQGYLVDFTTDTATHIFSLDGTSQAYYQDYASNGLLYILDYGNSRMLMLDPANGYAQVGQFALNPDVTVANEQFGIGADGDIYLGDGAGGGSAYSSTGTFLSTFGLPSGYTPSTSVQGVADVFAEADGSIYVVDPVNGAVHVYTDSDVGDAPEPSTMSLLFVSAGVGLFFRRRLVALRAFRKS